VPPAAILMGACQECNPGRWIGGCGWHCAARGASCTRDSWRPDDQVKLRGAASAGDEDPESTIRSWPSTNPTLLRISSGSERRVARSTHGCTNTVRTNDLYGQILYPCTLEIQTHQTKEAGPTIDCEGTGQIPGQPLQSERIATMSPTTALKSRSTRFVWLGATRGRPTSRSGRRRSPESSASG
jgi:hypothetical protein